MDFKNDYNEIKFTQILFKITKMEENDLIRVTIWFLLFTSIICSISTITSLSSYLILLILTYLYTIFSRKMTYLTNNIKCYLHKDFYHLGINQKLYLNKSSDLKKDDNFVVIDKNLNFSTREIEHNAIITVHEEYLSSLEKYEYTDYINKLIPKTISFTIFPFLGLLAFLQTQEGITNNNLIFALSIWFTYYLSTNTQSILASDRRNAFFNHFKITKKNSKLKIKIENKNVYKNNDDNKNVPLDITGVVFGILFTLYTTLIFNTIYSVSVKTENLNENKITTSRTS